ncbi:glycosyltransferase [Flavobacterium limnosediminis JC2902]|uniref:Glycosyltransferase n=1 Tax=Flavobacterium limnosediminis JC2902 TaxID=1341181 RepID=V6SHB1_9FLAO|nr:glycosyltransferase [Flavobacterium limnosediminis]ESU25839.1 glycosyltransferase [Flavobacterium limnosediminis JC2902]
MNIPKRNHKIALIGYTLNSGGLERVMSSLSVYFGNQGIEVHNIVLVDDVGYPYSGTLVNIGKMKEQHKGIFGKLQLLRFLKKYLQQGNFDFIIDFRYRIKPFQEVLMANWVYKTKTIYTVHSGNTATYIPESKFLANLIFKNKYAVVCVSDAIKVSVEKMYDFQNLHRIYNPINLSEIQQKSSETIPFEFQYVMGMGRFDYYNVKQFDRLIAAYLESDLPQKSIHLILIGEGERRAEVEKLVESHPKIHFTGFQQNPYPYLKNALFLVVCSKYEGFPMSVIEAMACGTPVVAFDGISGPNEVIVNEKNGLLAENQNFEDLKNKMNRFVSDADLYRNCKAQTLPSAAQFSTDKIGKQWLDLMKIEVLS